MAVNVVSRGGSRTTWRIKELAFPTRENRTAERSRTCAETPNPAEPLHLIGKKKMPDRCGPVGRRGFADDARSRERSTHKFSLRRSG